MSKKDKQDLQLPIEVSRVVENKLTSKIDHSDSIQNEGQGNRPSPSISHNPVKTNNVGGHTDKESNDQNNQQKNNSPKGGASKKDSLAKSKAKNQANKMKKQVRKKARELAKKVIKTAFKKGIALLGKALAAMIGTVGMPLILLLGFLVVVVIVTLMVSSMALGTGEGVDELDDNAKVLHEYIKELSINSVDPSKPEQYIYRVPEALLASVAQLDSLTKEYEEQGRKDVLADHKKLLALFAKKLKPKFTYETFNEYTETRTRSCDDETGECTGWSTSRTDTPKELLTHVKAWNGDATIKYKSELTAWSGSDTHQTRQLYYYEDSNTFDYNFEMLDQLLNEQKYKDTDKRIFEMFYEATTGTKMYYTNWLNGEDISGSIGDAFNGLGPGGDFGDLGNVIPGAGVPSSFMPIYLAAQQKYGVPWYYLAAIHKIETTFSTNLNTSSAGAVGHTQFMPCTWVGWSHPSCSGLGRGSISSNELVSLSAIKKYGGYGQDGNGDGKADPWNIYDAIFSTAYLLQKNGINKNPKKAIHAYNHADWYVKEVLADAEKFKNEATYSNGNYGSAIEAGKQWIGKSRYVFGGGRTQSDISKGIFDCSSFVHWAFKQAGVDLGPLSSTSTETLNKKGKKIPADQMQIGDLVFFDTYKKDGHVGIYIGNGQFLGAQTSDGVSTRDFTSGYWKDVFKGHVRRM